MQIEEISQTDLFFSSLKAAHLLHAPSDAFVDFRKRAWDHLLEIGYPEKKQEAFQYVPLRQLFQSAPSYAEYSTVCKESLNHLIYPECLHSHIVFVDGFFRADLSDLSAISDKVVVLDLSQAMKTYGAFLQNRLVRTLKEETDPFAALNAAMGSNGVFLFVPPEVRLTAPIQCLQWTCTRKDVFTVSSPRIQLFMGRRSGLEWISSAHLEGENPSMINAVIDVALEEEADFRQVQSIWGPPSLWHFNALRATLKKNSRMHSISVCNGSKTARQDYRVSLNGEGAEAGLKGVSMLSERNQAHVHVLMEHLAPNTQSTQLFKCLLSDFSQSSFEGQILVRQSAQKTQAYQLNQNMILDERAIANSKPNLKIYADDVKASHGATIAKLDPAELFYLRTRGFSEQQAKMLLVQGFCREVIDQIPVESLRDQIQEYSRRYLKGNF